jgi:hypothetical protein
MRALWVLRLAVDRVRFSVPRWVIGGSIAALRYDLGAMENGKHSPKQALGNASSGGDSALHVSFVVWRVPFHKGVTPTWVPERPSD